MRDWPVVVTNRCAQACAKQFGLSQSDGAKAWLYQMIDERGTVTSELPRPVAPLDSSSGFFMVADRVVVLPLAKASDGTARWVATDCKLFPGYRRRHGGAARRRAQADPFGLTPPELIRHTNLTNAVARFQQRCGGDRDPAIAREELLHDIANDATAVARPPDWYRGGSGDFYIVSGDEYVLPASCRGSAGYFFDALDCVHRAAELFRLRGAALAARCRFDERAMPSGSPRRELLTAALTADGELAWHPPPWARPHPFARFWVTASGRLAAPVAWQPQHARHPLLILDLAERLSLADRARRWLGDRRASAS